LLLYYNVVDVPSLRALAKLLVPFLMSRRDALKAYMEASAKATIQASDKTKALWKEREMQAEELLLVYATAEKDDGVLSEEERSKRSSFLKTSWDYWHVKLRKVLVALDKEMLGPFALGDQVSIADMHLAPWLARIVKLSGGSASDDGDTIVAKLEARVGDNFAFTKDFTSTNVPDLKEDPELVTKPGTKRVKLAAFWDEMKLRPSWNGVYGEGLF